MNECVCLVLAVDNRSLKPRQRNQVDIGEFMGDSPRDRPHISSQHRLAVYQFLSSSKSHYFHTCMYIHLYLHYVAVYKNN